MNCPACQKEMIEGELRILFWRPPTRTLAPPQVMFSRPGMPMKSGPENIWAPTEGQFMINTRTAVAGLVGSQTCDRAHLCEACGAVVILQQ